MKKLISILIATVLFMGALPAFAQSTEEIVLCEELFDRIEEVCKNAGCTVFRSDVSIGVQNGTVGFVVMNDTVSYMENGMLVKESLYVDGVYVKIPEKALLSVLGDDYKKSDAYKKAMESFQTKLSAGRYIQETINTDYGTIVIWGSGGHMQATSNEISYVRYDGETIYITGLNVPYMNTWMPCKYSSIEISEDGEKAIITYPEIKETVIFSPGAENRTLCEKGQMIVTVDLINCTAEYVNHPLEEEPEEPKEEEKPAKEETATGGSVRGLYLPDNSTGSNLMWSYSDNTLTISGTGDTPVYGMSYGSGKMGQEITTIKRPKEWAEYFEEIEEIVLTDEPKTIADGFFAECVNVKRLVIGAGVVFNETSFKNSQTLESVTISDKVTVANQAFENCEKLEKITLHNNTSLGERAFFGCDNLDVEFKSNNVTIGYMALNDTAFYNSNDCVVFENELVWMKDSLKSGDIILPEGITRIPAYFFRNSSVTSIVIPEGVNCIGKSAFRNCKDLTKVTFPKGNDFVIEGYAFSGTGLENLTITKNMKLNLGNVSTNAFSGCEKLRFVMVEEGVESLAPFMFAQCKNLSEVNLPQSLAEIPQGIFYLCTALEYISIGENVTKIGDSAFSGSGIVSIVIPKNVTETEGSLFSSCKSLKNVIIDARITAVGDYMFSGCSALEEVYFSDTIEAIGEGAFYNSKINTLKLPKRLKTIEQRAFSYTKTEEVIIPEGCETIEEKAFYYSNIKKLSIPGSVTNLPKEMCANSQELTELTIENGVRVINTRAFSECDKLEKVILPESIETLGYETFKWCENLKEVNIPKNVTEIPEAFAYGCSNLTKVTIENENLTHLGRSAFGNCGKLTDINLPQKLLWVGSKALDKTPLYLDKANWKDGFFIIGDVLFDMDQEVIGEKVRIPDNVRVLPSLGFVSNEAVVEVVVPEGVKVLPYGLFYSCKNLKKVVLPESLEKIEESVFEYCQSLEPVRIPKGVTTIE